MFPEGLIAFPITPAASDGAVDVAALRRLIARTVDAGVDAVCVLGSTGSYPYLTRAARRSVVVAAAAELRARLPLFAGIGALRTDDAVGCAKDAAAAGADLGLLAAMSYAPLTEREVVTHFTTVADEGGLPVGVYDNPAATHFQISDALMQTLCRLPGVVGLKAPAPPAPAVATRLAALRMCAGSGVSVGFSVDANAAEGLIAGADAWYSVLAGLFPAPLVAIRRALLQGEVAAARRIDATLQPMWDLFKRFGGLRVMYAAASLTGVCEASPPRPLLPLEAHALAEVRAVLDALKSTLSG